MIRLGVEDYHANQKKQHYNVDIESGLINKTYLCHRYSITDHSNYSHGSHLPFLVSYFYNQGQAFLLKGNFYVN